jgi:hypothetical protein
MSYAGLSWMSYAGFRFILDVLRWFYAGCGLSWMSYAGCSYAGCPTLVGGTGYLSTRKMPDLSFGSNQVDLGGITRSASATAMRSSIAVG